MAFAGHSYRRRRKLTDLFVTSALFSATPAYAARPVSIAIPATKLSKAILLLAEQTGADITTTEADISTLTVTPLSGRYSAAAALHRLLAHTRYRAVAINANSFRIVLAPKRRVAPEPPKSTQTVDAPIVVTASKQPVKLLRFPGSIQYIGSGAVNSMTAQNHNIDDIARILPVLQMTELGKGRNKIFIRSVADSSFNGATQSAASIYFGDVQTSYSGADPGLALYDVRSVEILEGPQGTLYGAGSLSGIIRITPNPVDLGRTLAGGDLSVTVTQDGGTDYGGNAVVNLPIISDRLGIRAVAYHQRDGGFIDDRFRQLKDVNTVVTTGGRLAVRGDLGDGWQVDTSAVLQDIAGADGQYATADVGPLARNSVLAQPWSRTVLLGRVVITKTWDSNLQLVSATGIVSDRSQDNFDATGVLSETQPILYFNQTSNLFVSHETRLSRTLPNGRSWLIGSAALFDRNIETRTVGAPASQQDIIGVTNTGLSLSVFAEATIPLGRTLSLTTGARLTQARNDGVPTPDSGRVEVARGLTTSRIDPTLAVSWQLAQHLAAFGRFQTGFRTGGIAVARGIGRVADFRADSIIMGEIGLRSERPQETGIAFSAALSFARWSDIQADLVARRGQPYTSNIGDADIYGAEGTVDWVPIRGLTARAAFFFTHNQLYGSFARTSVLGNQRLPQTPSFASNANISYRWKHGIESELHVGATARYVGRSVLGTSNFLDVSQGNYATFGLFAGWAWRKFATSVMIDNIADSRANRFAYGNPFLISARNQVTPLQPRNIRFAISVPL